MLKVVITSLSLFLLMISCQPILEESNSHVTVEDAEAELEISEVVAVIEESQNYLENRDFDGDQISDFLYFDYSGGAHCCYTMSLKLSSMQDTLHYPFEMDGGYGFGIVDGSQHDQFNVEDYDKDGLPEIFMMIATYNGEKSPLEKEWTDIYGITSNYILFDYLDGQVQVVNYDTLTHKYHSLRLN